MNEVPFHRVYITGLVRDAEGQKMSKTRGNVVDPLQLIERQGADALRFTMAAMATPGSDLPLSEERMAGYRAFANKIWNAARFVLMNLGEAAKGRSLPPVPPTERLDLRDRWILSRLSRLASAVEESLEGFRFDDMANAIYQFLWHEYCDWYLEMAKPSLLPLAAAAEADRTRAVMLNVLERVLRLLHPVMPFLTEVYPSAEPAWLDGDAERQIALLMDIVARVRNLRAALNIDPGRRLRLLYHTTDAAVDRSVTANLPMLATLARLERIQKMSRLDGQGPAARAVVAGCDLAVPLEGVLDFEAERRRLQKEIDKLVKEREGHSRKLRNAEFMSKARPEAIDKVRRIDRELGETLDRLDQTLRSLA